MERGLRALVVIVIFVMVGFVLGGWVGREVGRRSPSFVEAIYPSPPEWKPKNLDPAEFGQGLGMVCGLFFGAAREASSCSWKRPARCGSRVGSRSRQTTARLNEGMVG